MPFYGKYRGKVSNNVDPLQLGRLQVSCAAVLGDGRLSWALPAAPVAGPGTGLFVLPPKGANIWVEFEGGDPDFPIWSGCFWDPGQVPAKPAVEQMTVLKTKGVELTVSDLPGPGGVSLEVKPPAASVPMSMVFNSAGVQLKIGSSSLKLDADGIEITSASIKINAASDLKVAGGATVDLKAGGNAKLTAAMVNINNGALEVT